MIRIVLDTNVIVSGFLSQVGPPARIVDMVMNREIRVCYNDSIIREYYQVMSRPHFGFTKPQILKFLSRLEQNGEDVFAEIEIPSLPDPTDEMFLSVALSAEVPYLITGNSRHFPLKKYGCVTILTPRDFFLRE